MSYIIEINQDDKTIANGAVSAACALRVLVSIMNQKAAEAGDVRYVERGTHHTGAPSGSRKKYKKRAPKLDSDLMQEAARRHPATQQIEDMLIEGMTAAAIMEQVEVSPPTIGVIRSRLRKEGRLAG